MKRRLLQVLSLAALVAAGIGASPSPADTLKIAAFSGPRTPTVSRILAPWVERLRADAGDALEIQTFWGGALGPPNKQFQLLLGGIADVALVLPGLIGGRFPHAPLVELPYFLSDPVEAAEVQSKLHDAGLIGGLDGLHALAFFASGPGLLHFNEPVTRLEDLHGRKIIANGAQYLRIARLLGMVPISSVILPKSSETIALGVVAGAVMNWSAYRAFRLDAVARHHVALELGLFPMMIVINGRSYARLDPALRQVLDRHSGAVLSRTAGAVNDAVYRRLAARHEDTPGHTILRLDPAQRAAMIHRLAPLHSAYRDKSAANAKRYDAAARMIAAYRAAPD